MRCLLDALPAAACHWGASKPEDLRSRRQQNSGQWSSNSSSHPICFSPGSRLSEMHFEKTLYWWFQWQGAAAASHAIVTCHHLTELRMDRNPLGDAACASLVVSVHSRAAGLSVLNIGRCELRRVVVCVQDETCCCCHCRFFV